MQKAEQNVKHIIVSIMKSANVMLQISVFGEAMLAIAKKQNVKHLPVPVSAKKLKKLLTYINSCDIIFEIKNKAEISTLTQKQLSVWCSYKLQMNIKSQVIYI